MDKILEIKNLCVEYQNIQNDNINIIKAVNNISLNVNIGEIYAIAGESGCGKSTIAKAITKLIIPKSGKILYKEQNIFTYNKSEQKLYPTKVQMVFQNPYSSLNPKMKIIDILKEPLDINTNFSNEKKLSLIKEIIEDVGLAVNSLQLYPHQFSGGQRQRIAIARALILNPELLIADEPVSALDASIQAQIINLLKDLKKKKQLTILFISHDLNVIKYFADKVGIMHNGQIIEENYTHQIFNLPREEYTKRLLSAAPQLLQN